MKVKFISKSPGQTIALGARLARKLKKGDIVCLFGNLGTGKTTLTKGIAKGLKIRKETVNSPTFILMNVYKGKLPLFHFDLYRLDNLKEIAALGYEDFFYDNGVSVIEWADKLKNLLPEDCVAVHFFMKGRDRRVIELSATQKRSREILKALLI